MNAYKPGYPDLIGNAEEKLAELSRAERAGFYFCHEGGRWYARLGSSAFGRSDGYPYLFSALADVIVFLDQQGNPAPPTATDR